LAVVKFEWDPNKAAANLKKHKVSFKAVVDFEFETAVYEIEFSEDGEERAVAFGWLNGKLHALVYVEKEDGAVRVISLRRADKRENRYYVQAIQKGR